MRRGFLELSLIIIAVIGIHAERFLHNGSIVGRIFSSSPSPTVIAVRGKDSVRVISNDGRFGMELQPGAWKLIFASNNINGAPTEKNVHVFEGKRINLGDIRLTE